MIAPVQDAGLDASTPALPKRRVNGRVFDAETGKALDGADLAAKSGERARSGKDGAFELAAKADPKEVRISRPSYAASAEKAPKAGGYMEVFIKSIDRSVDFRGDEGVRVELKSGASIDVPAGAVRDAEGKVIDGPVTLEMTEIKGRERAQAAALPGDGDARRENAKVGRVSVEGALDIRIHDGKGRDFTVDESKDVIAELPAREVDAPLERGLWSFDTSRGEWREEGLARRTLNDRGERVYRAKIKHLSWWGYGDFFEHTTCVRACTKNGDGDPVAFAQVWVVGASKAGVSAAYTDEEGCSEADAIADSAIVLVAQSAGLVSNPLSVATGSGRACTDAGVLVLGAPTDATCPAGYDMCSGRCVDVATSVDHCGLCGMACARTEDGRTEQCVAGECSCASDADKCQSAGQAICVNEARDLAHCGACGVACDASEECVGGACRRAECPSGSERCGPECVDLQTNAANCGACARACGGSATCIDGSCTSVMPPPDAGQDAGGVSDAGASDTDAGGTTGGTNGGTTGGTSGGTTGGTSGGTTGEADASASAPDAGDTNGGTTGELDAGTPPALPQITSFSGPAQACAGTKVNLGYAFSGGNGLIMPGELQALPPFGQATATLQATTTYTLSVTGPGGGPVTAQTTVTALTAPSVSITAPATVAHKQTGVLVSVPTQASRSYAWSISSGDAAITAGATSSQATLSIGTTGTSIDVQVIVTDTQTQCTTTVQKSIAIPCGIPQVLSFDRTAAPGTLQYVPGNMDTRPVASLDGSTIWAPHLVHKVGSPYAIYDYNFARSVGGAASVPSGAPALLTAAAANVFYVKVATDSAGDAVFVWTETSDNNNYLVQMRAYRASDSTWLPTHQVGTVFDQAGPVSLAMHATTGDVIFGWVPGPYGSQIPHFRKYALATDTLGTDTKIKETTTNSLAADRMGFSLVANGSLDGAMAWFEQGTSIELKVVHISGGTPDTDGQGGYDIQTLATSATPSDEVSINSLMNQTAQYEPTHVAVSANGNIAVMWSNSRYDSQTTITTATLNARRYFGAWGDRELAASQAAGTFSNFYFAIDNQGDMILAERTHGYHNAFAYGPHDAAWSPLQVLTTNPTSTLPYVALDSATGKGAVTFRDLAGPSRAPLKAARFDPTTRALSAPFTVDNPTESAPDSGRPFIDAAGKLSVVFVQSLTSPPPGSNSTNGALLYLNECP